MTRLKTVSRLKSSRGSHFLPLGMALGLTLALSISLSACEAPGGGRCTTAGFGDIPIINQSGTPIVRANVNGHPVAFAIDSGADITIMYPDAANTLDLETTSHFLNFSGIDGASRAPIETARFLSLGTGTTRNAAFMVTPMHGSGSISGLPVVGLFGEDYLANYDFVLDMPDHAMALYRVDGCKSPTPGWEGKTHRVPAFTSGNGTQLQVTIRVNDTPIDVIVDSGSNTTMIPLEDARRAGVTDAMLRYDRKIVAFGAANAHISGWYHRFESFQIGDIQLRNVMIEILPEQNDALLGADFMRGHRVWIPMNRHAIYVQSHAEIPANDPARQAFESR